ncbi:MAG: hypothetical protein GY820_39570 [Gammaproteobacteria bacterium]|nr:hypothetical protein [Gammaproteobacteria bacterium]
MANTFKNLQDSVIYQIGDHSGATIEKVKRWLNDTRNGVWEQVDGIFKEETDYLTTTASYKSTTAITVTVTEGSTTVTSDGATNTAFTSAMEGRFIRLSGSDPWYKISSVTSATELVLEDAYIEDTEAGASFEINTYLYPLPTTVQRLILVSAEIEENWAELVIKGRVEVLANIPVPLRWDVGTPEVVWLDEISSGALQLGIFPAPENVTLVRFRYYKDPTEMSADSDVVGIPGADLCVKAGTLAEVYAWRGKPKESALWYARYETELERLKVTVNRSGRTSFRMRDRTDAVQSQGVRVNLGPWYSR